MSGLPRAATRPRAVLAAVQLPGKTDVEHDADLAELERLVHTLGYEVIARLSQRRETPSAATIVGEGKLKELAALTGGKGEVPSGAKVVKTKAQRKREADHGDDHDDDDEGEDVASKDAEAGKAELVVIDDEITPTQAKNLERATGAQVMDRTGVIVEIFHRHARSREARLQVEIARLTYVAPRLRETGGGGERQRGRGAGETALELDRRKIRDRIAELRQELAAIQKEQQNRRALRQGHRRVALVGYTNAGKSSLMRALTGSEVLVEDKLFATLDTTVRALAPESKPRILVSDTVGFIKKLPHDLVASFRSTLDEALEASLLLYVADASDPTFREQLQVTRSVLGEIGAGGVPGRLLLNKVDRLGEAEQRALAREFPEAILLSAKREGDVAKLRETLVAFFEEAMVEGEIVVPYGRQNVLGEVWEEARVLGEDYDEVGARFRVKAHPVVLARLQALARGN